MPSIITDRVSNLGASVTPNGDNATISQKVPCRVATAANITLSELQTLDTVTVVADDRVLVKDQTDASKNGIYLASADVWQRANDCVDAGDLVKGSQVRVNEGPAGTGSWYCTSPDPIVIGTDDIIWQDNAATVLSGAQIKSLYEAEADTNPFDDADAAKLAGVEAGADVTDTANVEAAGAVMDSEVDADIKTLSLPANVSISTLGASLIAEATTAAARARLKLDGFVFVNDYGDTSTGDDTTVLQAALDDVSPGTGVLLVPGQTYTVTNIKFERAYNGYHRGFFGCLNGTGVVRKINGGSNDYLAATQRWVTGEADSNFPGEPWDIQNVLFDAAGIAGWAFVNKTYQSHFHKVQFWNGTIGGCLLTRQNQNATLGTTVYNPNNFWTHCYFRGNAIYSLRSEGTAADPNDASSDGFVLDCAFDGRNEAGNTSVTDYAIHLAAASGWHVTGNHTFGSTVADFWGANFFKNSPIAYNTFEEPVIIDKVGSAAQPARLGPGNKFWSGVKTNFTTDTSIETLIIDGNDFLEDLGGTDAFAEHNNDRSQKSLLFINNNSLTTTPVRLGVGNTNGIIRVFSGNLIEGGAELERTVTHEVTGGSENEFFEAYKAQSDNAGANAGPYYQSYRNSPSPAANDFIGIYNFKGNSSTLAARDYAYIQARIIDPTNTSENGKLYFGGQTAGAYTYWAELGPGLSMTGATGGDKGAGTLNAVGVYDDNTLLTCMALAKEFREHGRVDLAKWDAMVPGDGEHHAARYFAKLIGTGFDPRDTDQYFKKMKTDEALPGMPSQADWKHGKLSSGEMISRLWLAVEMLAVTIDSLRKK